MYFLRSIVLLVCLGVTNLAVAKEDVAKVGYFDLVRVMNNIPQAKQAEKRLGAEFEQRKKKLEQFDGEVKLEQSQFERDKQVMSDVEREKKRREIRNRSRELKLSIQEYQEDLSLRQNQETASLQKLVRQAVLEVAKEDGYDLIIDQGAVLFASDKVDITKKVMQRLSVKVN